MKHMQGVIANVENSSSGEEEESDKEDLQKASDQLYFKSLEIIRVNITLKKKIKELKKS